MGVISQALQKVLRITREEVGTITRDADNNFLVPLPQEKISAALGLKMLRTTIFATKEPVQVTNSRFLSSS